ncbi:hypothetical protein IEO21_03875 [Rhodonia placenta]|uniref:Uncharacterized protein n=1 Tax=Rhodonia placenta TaxID=104341 RepID=A0A8H7U3S0_9APHY|nr:hypothetical protein IEO21_03875 [Postia placenta]
MNAVANPQIVVTPVTPSRDSLPWEMRAALEEITHGKPPGAWRGRHNAATTGSMGVEVAGDAKGKHTEDDCDEDTLVEKESEDHHYHYNHTRLIREHARLTYGLEGQPVTRSDNPATSVERTIRYHGNGAVSFSATSRAGAGASSKKLVKSRPATARRPAQPAQRQDAGRSDDMWREEEEEALAGHEDDAQAIPRPPPKDSDRPEQYHPTWRHAMYAHSPQSRSTKLTIR